MNGDHAASLLYIVGGLALVGSALAARRLPLGQTAKMALAWLVIFAVAFAAFTLRDDFRSLGSRLASEINGAPVEQGGALRISRESDGHYWVNADVNGHTTRFLIDSGASLTVLSRETAAKAGIEPAMGVPAAVQTANGLVFMKRSSVTMLKIGSIERRDLAVWLDPGEDDVNVLGMNFLSSLSSWGTEGRTLVLRP